MDSLGIEIDSEKNNQKSSDLREIQKKSSSVKILVIPTNEELEIAKQSFKLLNA
jgi:acetate kinase